MKVIKAKTLGFCMGVRRAVELAFNEAKQANGSPVYTFGPLIHNPKVLNDLNDKGIKTLDELPQDCENCTVIIRAHGISLQLENELRAKGCRIIDATCPKVKASQLKTEELSRAGYCIFLAGENAHAEIEGIKGYAACTNECFCEIAGSAQEALKKAKNLYNKNHDAKTALLGQTTISEDEYRVIGEKIGLFFPNLEIVQTICAATKERQNALRDLLLEVDAVIIAGGKNSANTRRLLAIAQECGKPAVLAQDASEIPQNFFSYETVGICAGASTPDSVIEEIEAALKTYSK